MLTLGESTIYINHDWQAIRTSYPDGTFAELWTSGVPPDQAREWATALGYDPPDPWEHLREHDLIHTWLAVKMGLPHSPTLRSVAHRGGLDRGEIDWEEWLVTEFQRYLNTGERAEYPLRHLEDRGLSVETLRAEAVDFFRGS